MSVWDKLESDSLTTSKQRQALYRLGYSRWLVQQLDRHTAALAIQKGLELITSIRGKELGIIPCKPVGSTLLNPK